nr:uncharacterized protein LOC115266093 [Aedes albopictus]
MDSFKYSCGCTKSRPRRIPVLHGSRSYDPSETAKLDKALDQLIDSAWDDRDEEADQLLACFLGNLKKDNYAHTEADLSDILKDNPATQNSNSILSSLHEYPGESCHCREVMHRVSIVLNWGLAELQCNTEPCEQRLLEALHQLDPFIEMIENENTWKTFLQRLWNFSVDSSKLKLTAKIIAFYPDEINQTLENLLNSDLTDPDALLDNENFNSVVTLITIPEVFQHVSFHLARQDAICPGKTQTLLAAILKALRSNVSKSRFLALYPETIRSVALMMYEAIDPDDPLLVALLEQTKRENVLDLTILVTHFPMFLHLK